MQHSANVRAKTLSRGDSSKSFFRQAAVRPVSRVEPENEHGDILKKIPETRATQPAAPARLEPLEQITTIPDEESAKPPRPPPSYDPIPRKGSISKVQELKAKARRNSEILSSQGGAEQEANSDTEKQVSAGLETSPNSEDAVNRNMFLERFKESSGFRRGESIETFLAQEPDRSKDPGRHCRWRLANILDGTVGKIFFLSAVIVNGILIGVEADFGGSKMWDYIEISFLVIFTVEVALKVVAYGRLFFQDPWNIMDFTIVVLSLAEYALNLFKVFQSDAGLSAVRLVRVFRVVRIVSFLERLNQLVQAFALSLSSVGWVFVLASMVVYIFAVLARGLFGESSEVEDQKLWFGSVPRCLVTMIQFISMDSWVSSIGRPMGEKYPAAWVFFIVFLLFVTLGFLNLITAIFIDSLLEEKRRIETEKQAEIDSERMGVISLLAGLFETFDKDGNMELDRDEMKEVEEFLQLPETEELLLHVGLDLECVRAAVKFSDVDNDGLVSQEEFLAALACANDATNKKDLWEVRREVRYSAREMQELKHQMSHLQGLVEQIAVALNCNIVPSSESPGGKKSQTAS